MRYRDYVEFLREHDEFSPNKMQVALSVSYFSFIYDFELNEEEFEDVCHYVYKYCCGDNNTIDRRVVLLVFVGMLDNKFTTKDFGIYDGIKRIDKYVEENYEN